ncbi:cobalt-precorrin-7 (C(5))-methyltransferase [Halobaculum gomorrense]|uniref:Precorrin-6Y C5,15-methyltransferase (Decarboxylating) n=1 Tax=Halobaculum gomorrense TaxID=43928 RepID=A0A1M5PFW2_9EURY|nr:cobalt-precorrin-7 (C(5))-methyltransferase [Halobaculum gomorrense]SHH00642.1 precorrin-6Y C5,15-methyltransferase (decarboxylating) [Halobaculum gomorrense]
MSDLGDELTLPDRPGVAAAASVETDTADDTGSRVHAVGIGPGNPAFLTRRAGGLLAEADVVVGFETVADYVADETDADLLTCGYRDEREALARFGRRVADGEAGVAVLMGDPNHSGYQFLGKVEAAVDAPVRVVPGISSVQIAASRARTPLEESTFVTLHVRGDVSADLDRLARDIGDRHLIVIPRPYDWMPEDIAGRLVESGADPDLEAIVLERLTHPDESIRRTDLGSLAADLGGDSPEDSAFTDLSIVVIRR